MEIDVLKEKSTPLLSRKRIIFSVKYDKATPSRHNLRQEIAKKVNADEKLVILKHIYTRFGQQWAKVITHVYQNETDLKKFEDKKLVSKHMTKKEADAQANTDANEAVAATENSEKKEESAVKAELE